MIDEFNASQDEIHMTNDMVRFDDYYTRLTTALAAGTAPDVIVLHQARLINYVPSGVLLPLDEIASGDAGEMQRSLRISMGSHSHSKL